MKRFKQVVLRLFLVGEIVFFSYAYVFGTQGLRSMFELRKECKVVEQEIESLHCEIECVKSDIAQWRCDPFYKEKVAREQLGMAYGDECVYIVD